MYIGSEDFTLRAFDSATGTPLWSYLTGGQVLGGPTATSSAVYFGSNDNNVYALDASTGANLWTVDRQRKWDTFGPENKRDYCR